MRFNIGPALQLCILIALAWIGFELHAMRDQAGLAELRAARSASDIAAMRRHAVGQTDEEIAAERAEMAKRRLANPTLPEETVAARAPDQPQSPVEKRIGEALDEQIAAMTDVKNLVRVLKLYRLDNQRYPSAEQGLQALTAKPTVGTIPPNWKPYLDKLPNDPWGHPYQYANPGLKGEIDIYSLGADGVIGGEGKNAEIGSWQ